MPAKSAKYDAEHFGRLCFLNFLLSNVHHLIYLVHLLSEFLSVRIILKEFQVRVSDHSALNMKATITNEYDDVAGLGITA